MLTASDITTLAPGEKISRNGLYRIPITVHHSQCCDGVSVTSSVLRRMETHGPSKVWATSALNPNRWPSKETKALRLGRAAHAFVEGGLEQVRREYLILPDDKPRRPTAQQVAAYQAGTAKEAGVASVEFWAKVEEAAARGIDAITMEDFALIEAMGAALVADPIAPALLRGEPEITMAWQDDETGLWLLSRPDNLTLDGMVADYKKTNTQGAPFDHRHCDRVIASKTYDMQLSLIHEVYWRLTGTPPSAVAIVFQEDEPPFDTIVRAIGEETLYLARARNRRALRTFASCLGSGVWPGPGEDILEYQMPAWQQQHLQEQMDAGLLPAIPADLMRQEAAE